METATFSAPLEIIGINPFVFLPEAILIKLLKAFPNHRGKVPVKGTLKGNDFKQTLVKYSGEWRLYVNTTMLKNAPKHIAEVLTFTIEIDFEERKVAVHPKLLLALSTAPEAEAAFLRLRPSLQKEMMKYLWGLKTEISVDRNVNKAIDFLLGKGSFVGRKHPDFSKTRI